MSSISNSLSYNVTVTFDSRNRYEQSTYMCFKHKATYFQLILKFTLIIYHIIRLLGHCLATPSTGPYYSAIWSLSSHALNWFLSPLSYQETGTLHTSDQIVEYMYYSQRIFLRYENACKSSNMKMAFFFKLVCATACYVFYQTSSLACLTLNAPITTKVVCVSRLLKCLRSKQCGRRLEQSVLGPRCLLLYLIRQ